MFLIDRVQLDRYHFLPAGRLFVKTDTGLKSQADRLLIKSVDPEQEVCTGPKQQVCSKELRKQQAESGRWLFCH